MVSCEHVLELLSDYVDGEVEAGLRSEIEAHLRMCHRCSVLVDSTRKVLLIYGDDRVFEIPAGYSERLHAYIDEHLGS